MKSDEQPEPENSRKTVAVCWKSVRDPGEESRYELSASCKDAMDDSSEDETDHSSDDRWEKRWKERLDERKRMEEQEKQPWPTDMAEEWKLTSQGDEEDGPGSMHILSR